MCVIYRICLQNYVCTHPHGYEQRLKFIIMRYELQK